MRQYVGARYVPKFFNNKGSNEWVRGVSYEYMTIVTYINNTYISLKNVPSNVGNPAETPEYWVNMANYNAQFNDLKETVDTFDGQLTQAQSDISGLEDFVSRGFTSLGNLNVLIITDSYGQGAPNIQTWVALLANEISRKGGKSYHIANGGGGFIASGQQGTFTDCLNRAPKNNFNLIIVQGIVNDMGNTPSTINQAMYGFYNNARAKFPGVPIMLFNCSKNKTVGSTTRKYREELSKYAKWIGFIYADMSPYYILDKNNIGSDNVHPTQEGHYDIYRGVMEFIQKRSNFLERSYANASSNPYFWIRGSQVNIMVTNSNIIREESGLIIPIANIPWLWGNSIDYYGIGRALYQNATHPIVYVVNNNGVSVQMLGETAPMSTLIVQNSYLSLPLDIIG